MSSMCRILPNSTKLARVRASERYLLGRRVILLRSMRVRVRHLMKPIRVRAWILLLPVQVELGDCLTHDFHLLGQSLLILENLVYQLSADVQLSCHLLLHAIYISHLSKQQINTLHHCIPTRFPRCSDDSIASRRICVCADGFGGTMVNHTGNRTNRGRE